MKTELTRFTVKQNKSERVDEWMKMLKDNIKDVLLTLEDEKMYIEAIFREKEGEYEYLYWFSVQGENGTSVEKSNHEIDKKHLEYWKECIEPNSKKDMDLQFEMIPKNIRKFLGNKN